ncbi:MAG TPA: universal stress protein [Bacteroidia bacterium]|nr:universal stress protein [Bacteroidia bacterium]
MKTILVPLDFSESAFNAAMYAVDLAKAANAIVHLLNVYHIPNPLKTLPLEIIITPDELKANSDSMLKQASLRLKGLRPDCGPVVCTSQNGFTTQEIEHYTNFIHADLIVMGMRGSGKIREKLLGSTTTGLISQSATPILVIPENAPYRLPKKILFASDGSAIHSQSHLKILFQIAQLYGSTIDIVTILSKDNMHKRESIMDILERSFLNSSHQYHFLDMIDVSEGINDFISKHETDMLVMLPRKHSFMEHLFERSHTRSLAFHTHIPLLTLPD